MGRVALVWTRRLVKLLVFTLVVAATCIALGIWQIARLHQKQQFNATVRSGLASASVSITALAPDGVDPEAIRYRRAEATGTYDVEHELVLYGRSRDGQAGNHLLTPLVLDDGTAVIVDRGWVPEGISDPGAPASAPPLGSVRVEGVMFPSDAGDPGTIGSSSASVTTLAKIDLERIQAQLPYRIEPAYLLLQAQSPPQPSLPEPASLPELSEGPHLSYAIQWFTFAAIALIGFIVLALREGRDGAPAGRDGAG